MLWLTLFLGAVFLLKLSVALQFDTHPLLQPDTGLDTTAYAELARRVVGGDLGLGPGLYYVSPLYIYVLALTLALTKTLTAARVLQSVLGTVSVGLIFLTARHWFGRRAAWLAAGLAALTGLFTFYEGLILQSSLDVLLASLALWLLTLTVEKQRASLALLAGAALGVASLNRPNMIVAAAGVALALLVWRRSGLAGILLLGLGAGLAPVTVRNLVVAHQWSLVSSHGGINFYIGNGPGATGYFHPVAGMRSTVEGLALDARRVAETSLQRKLNDREVSTYYSGLAWKWIRSHPGWWAGLLLRKSYAVFNTAHVSIPFSYTFYAYDAGTLLRYCWIGPWLLVPLGVFGLARARTRPWSSAYKIWLSFLPAYAVSIVVFFVTERYKLPLFVPLTIGAGAGLNTFWRDLAARRIAPLAAGLAIVAALFVAANWPLRLDDGRLEERTRMAEYHAGRGEVAEAERWTALALAGAPDPSSIHSRVGGQFVNSRLAGPAISHLQSSAQLRPGQARTEYLLGRALLGAGRPAEAVPHLRQALALRVDVALAGYDLAVALQQTGDAVGSARALRALRPPPDTPAAVWLQLGKRAGEVNALDVAEQFFRRAVAAAPELARAHHLLALDLLVLQRYNEAAAEFTLTARLDPRNADALAALAYCEQRLGRREDARRHAADALALDPDHPIARTVQQGIEKSR